MGFFTRRADSPTQSGDSNSTTSPVELIHPFYLDTEMSMAFAAAISGGVALQSEDLQREGHESQAVRNIQGNLRAFDLLGVGAQRGSSEAGSVENESRFIRQHTEASIFIALHDELQRRNQINELQIDTLEPGQLISATLGPAVAPLRRVVDQIIRFFEVAAPMMGIDLGDADEAQAQMTRQQRRQAEREAAKMGGEAEEADSPDLSQIIAMFRAIKEDLDQSGMLDVVVHREEEPSVVLTLDKRFTPEPVLELLHTSQFTVIGKVTEIWRSEEEGVNLYRRSVTSLVPAMTQMVAWGMIGLLAGLASGIDVNELRASAFAAAGLEFEDAEDEQEPQEILLGDVTALTPTISGPAIQILPLAICA
ncbi:MAG TPA: hypothetical protein VG448_03380 [Solirubrobacterales bacterium]|nr:hypothetical protein [Solirubrobacterales bacterium]